MKEDGAALNDAYAAFTKSGFDVRELLVAIVKSRSFLYRSAEVMP